METPAPPSEIPNSIPSTRTAEAATSSPPNWISVAALLVAMAAFIVAAGTSIFTVKTWSAKRDADLVKIGVSVLRVDPEKEKQISEATRKWALDLIDANAGGVTFSSEAREQLLKKRLEYNDVRWGKFTWGSGDMLPNNPAQPPR